MKKLRLVREPADILVVAVVVVVVVVAAAAASVDAKINSTVAAVIHTLRWTNSILERTSSSVVDDAAAVAAVVEVVVGPILPVVAGASTDRKSYWHHLHKSLTFFSFKSNE
jgi:hypothetical protein